MCSGHLGLTWTGAAYICYLSCFGEFVSAITAVAYKYIRPNFTDQVCANPFCRKD